MSFLPEGALSSGKCLWQQLHASRHPIVELCGEKGVALFSFLLASSTIKPGQHHIAFVSLQRLHDVARQLGWSPDTVKRYVAVFRGLNLLQHYHDHRSEVQLRIPLGPYTPLSTFSALDALIGTRRKQRQLALKVKARYLSRFGDPTQGYSDEIRTTFQELSTILESEHLEPLKRQRLQMKIADLLTQLVCKSESSKGDLNDILDDLQAAPSRQEPAMPAQAGDSNEGLEAFCLIKKPEQGKEPFQQGDLRPQETLSSRHQLQQMGDSNLQQGDPTVNTSSEVAHQSERQGDPKTVMGDSMTQTLVQPDQVLAPQHAVLGDSNPQQGDPIAVQNTKLPQKNDQLGDSNAQTTLKAGDSMIQAAERALVSALPTYNVNYLISNITSNNVKRSKTPDDTKLDEKNLAIAKFLAGILEKYEYENGKPTFRKYIAAFKQYTPEVIGRAFLVTMVLLHRKHWQVRSRGATFTNQCKILSGDPNHPFVHYTLTEVEGWMQAWADLPYAELIAALVAQPLLPSSSLAPIIPSPSTPLLNREDARKLVEDMERDLAGQGESEVRVLQLDERYMVELLWDGARIPIGSQKEWQAYFELVQKCLKLQEQYHEE